MSSLLSLLSATLLLTPLLRTALFRTPLLLPTLTLLTTGLLAVADFAVLRTADFPAVVRRFADRIVGPAALRRIADPVAHRIVIPKVRPVAVLPVTADVPMVHHFRSADDHPVAPEPPLHLVGLRAVVHSPEASVQNFRRRFGVQIRLPDPAADADRFRLPEPPDFPAHFVADSDSAAAKRLAGYLDVHCPPDLHRSAAHSGRCLLASLPLSHSPALPLHHCGSCPVASATSDDNCSVSSSISR